MAKFKITNFVKSDWKSAKEIAYKAGIDQGEAEKLLLELSRGYNIERMPIGTTIFYRKFKVASQNVWQTK